MNILIPKTGENISVLMRRAGYRPDKNRFGASGPSGLTARREQSFARPAAGTSYPRFHIYYKEQEDGLLLKLHLDQKKPSYEGSTAHAGEYDGPLVEQEAERIKQLLGF